MSFWRPLGVFWRLFGASVVSLACWCHPFARLWLAWAVFLWYLWLSVDSFYYFWANLRVVRSMFYHCLENLGGVWLWFESARATLFLSRNFKRASRSHAKTGFFGCPKQSSHAGKTHLFKKIQIFRFSRTTFYLHGSSFFGQN